MNKNKTIKKIIIESIAIIVSIYGMSKLITGPIMFTYFTIISNIFIVMMLMISLIKDCINILFNKNIVLPNYIYTLKYLATVYIAVTFLNYLLVIAPTNREGFINSYLENGAGSFCVHIITPILAIIDFIKYDNLYKSEKKHTLLVTIFPTIYFVGIMIASFSGVMWENDMCVPYNFLNYKSSTGWFGFDLTQIGDKSIGIGVAYMAIISIFIYIGGGKLITYLRNIVNKEEKNK